LRSIYLNITHVLNELHFVMQEANFMPFAWTQLDRLLLQMSPAMAKIYFTGRGLQNTQTSRGLDQHVAGD